MKTPLFNCVIASYTIFNIYVIKAIYINTNARCDNFQQETLNNFVELLRR
jgi:hypothetical protein